MNGPSVRYPAVTLKVFLALVVCDPRSAGFADGRTADLGRICARDFAPDAIFGEPCQCSVFPRRFEGSAS
jgi:hypothetical protein